jgi:hypothetical protein
MSLYTTLSVEIVGTFCGYAFGMDQRTTMETKTIIDQLNEVI